MEGPGRASLLGLDDELILEHLLPGLSGRDQLELACASWRFCRLVRQYREVLVLEEEDGLSIGRLRPENTFSGVLGLCFDLRGRRTPNLTGVSAALAHAAQHWDQLRELVLYMPTPEKDGSDMMALRTVNAALLGTLPWLSAVSSLRHLQLHLLCLDQGGLAALATLTHLTSLLIRDHSYVPSGPPVYLDLSPLSAMASLRALAVRGVCPAPRGEGAPAAQASLPPALTALVLKGFDFKELQLWMDVVLAGGPAGLQRLEVWDTFSAVSSQDASARAFMRAYPAPMIEQLALNLTSLTELRLGILRRGRETRMCPVPGGDVEACPCRLPAAVTQLCRLRSLKLPGCQVALATAADWQALAALTALREADGIEALCAPPARLTFPGVTGLCLGTRWLLSRHGGQGAVGERVQWLPSVFPKLSVAMFSFFSGRAWAAASSSIAQLTGLSGLTLDLKGNALEAGQGAAAWKLLGEQLTGLRTLAVLTGRGASVVPDFSPFPQLEGLILCEEEGSGDVPLPAQQLRDVHILTSLSPLTRLTWLCLGDAPKLTPAVVLAVQAMMPRLRLCTVVDCESMSTDNAPGAPSDWDVMQGALRPGVAVEYFPDWATHEVLHGVFLPEEVECVYNYLARF